MNRASQKWLLKAASKEANPYMQAEILYSVLGDKKKRVEAKCLRKAKEIYEFLDKHKTKEPTKP